MCLIHDSSSSKKTVLPPWFSAVHMRLSWPNPNTRKLEGDLRSRTLRDMEISFKVCWGVMFEVA